MNRQRALALLTRSKPELQAPDGRMPEGIVLRLNKKTISVATGDGHQWNVAPCLLRLVSSAGDVQWS